MIDLHTHSLFSDGVLLPAELIQRAQQAGYETIALTDHVDESNFDFVIPRILTACDAANRTMAIRAIAGVELTHVQPRSIPELVRACRALGARLIVVHGETLVEPVPEGTNLSAVQAGIDILAHPGLISCEAAEIAARSGVCLEITARKGHCLSNGHVARMARQHNAKLVLNTDTHTPDNLISLACAQRIAVGAGLDADDYTRMAENSRALATRALQS
jgi:histidinol phosphatase-like PHP family hydrolase